MSQEVVESYDIRSRDVPMASRLARLPLSSRLVSLFHSPETPTQIQVYKHGSFRPQTGSVTPPCACASSILGLQINGKDYIATACANCTNIKILKMEDHEIQHNWVTVFEDRDYGLKKLIQGDYNMIFVYMVQYQRYKYHSIFTAHIRSMAKLMFSAFISFYPQGGGGGQKLKNAQNAMGSTKYALNFFFTNYL